MQIGDRVSFLDAYGKRHVGSIERIISAEMIDADTEERHTVFVVRTDTDFWYVTDGQLDQSSLLCCASCGTPIGDDEVFVNGKCTACLWVNAQMARRAREKLD
jgi:hypothetical protein